MFILQDHREKIKILNFGLVSHSLNRILCKPGV